MSLSRQSDSKNSQPATLDTKHFEELAKTRPEFENVGLVVSATENSESQFVIRSKNVEFPHDMGMGGSGVYMGGHIVITAAHCLPSSLKNGVFASGMKDQTYFLTKDNDGSIHSARVIMANRHPQYLMNNSSIKNIRNDIALLVIDREFKNLEPIRTHLTPTNLVEDCIHVGITRHAISSLPRNNIRGCLLEEFEPTRVAVKFPSISYLPYAGLQVTSLGASYYSDVSLFCGLLQFQSGMQHPYDPLETGPNPEMTGGVYFNNDSLLGIVSGMKYRNFKLGTVPAYPNFENYASPLPWDSVYCVPLFTHKKWIEKTLADDQKQLPELMLQSDQWYMDRKLYEQAQNNLSKFVSKSDAERKHEEQPLKKPILDKLRRKTRELYARENQDTRADALCEIYLAFKKVDFESEASLKSYHLIYKENVETLKKFDTSSIRRAIGSLFSSVTDTYRLITELNEFVENNSYPSEKIKYHIRYGEPY